MSDTLREARGKLEYWLDQTASLHPNDYRRELNVVIDAAVEGESRLRQIKAAHYDDEMRSHRRTRKLLARFLGVEVDTEEYDTAFDDAEIREEGQDDE